MRYDLSSDAAALWRDMLVQRAALLGAVAVGLGVSLFGIDAVLTLGGSWDNLFLVPAGLVFAALPGLGYWILSRTRIRAIGVDEGGVSFDLSSGKHIEIPWRDPNFWLSLADNSKWPKRPYPRAPPYWLNVRQYAGVWGYVPRAVYDALATTADSQGLWVDQRDYLAGLLGKSLPTTSLEIRPFPKGAAR